MMQQSKKHYGVLILIFILIFMYLPLTNHVALADDNPLLGVVNVDGTMLREGPGANHSPVVEIAEGTEVKIWSRDTSANWLYIEVTSNLLVGWLPTNTIKFMDDIDVKDLAIQHASSNLDLAQSPLPKSAYIPATFSLEHTDIALYTEPSLSAETVTLPEDVTLATILQRNQSGTWLEISLDEDTQGWVVLTAFVADEAFMEIWQNLSVQEVATQSTTQAPEAVLIDPQELIYVEPAITSTFARLNFRIGAATTHNSMDTLPIYTEIEVLAMDRTQFWLLVNVAGQEGWVFRQFVTDYDLVSLPNVPSTATNPDGENPPPPAVGYNYYSLLLQSSTAAQGDNDLDGRLNPYFYLAAGLIYCFDSQGYTHRGTYEGGGLAVYVYYADPQGVVFIAPESKIQAVGIPETATFIHGDSGFELYRLPNGLFQMNGPQIDGGRFSFQWNGCEVNPITQ